MEQKVQKITTILFVLFVLGFGFYFLVNDKKIFSENENRYLTKFPQYSFSDLKSGEYISEFESYLTDHFPLRDSFMGLKTSYQRLLNQKEINGVYIGLDEYLFEKYEKPIRTDELIQKLNEFYKNNQINMSLLLVPSSGLINSDKLPDNVSFELQEKVINEIYSKIAFNKINIIDSLKKGSLNNEMYYHLDHHWTTMGAYYGYLEFCKSNNIEPISIEEYRKVIITTKFNGTLYSKTNIYNYKSDEINIFLNNQKYKVNYVNSNKITNSLYEDKHLNTKDKYAYFLDGNHPLITIDTDVKNRKEILIIKDSYANSFIPFLTSHYEKIHIIDLRFYNLSTTNYIKENKIDNVLFLYSIQGIDNDLGIYNIR